MNKFKYSVDDDGEDFSDAEEFETIWDMEYLGDLSIDAAKHDYASRDGWEASWPRIFTIWSLAGKRLGTRTVGMDTVPHFYMLGGRPIEKEEAPECG